MPPDGSFGRQSLASPSPAQTPFQPLSVCNSGPGSCAQDCILGGLLARMRDSRRPLGRERRASLRPRRSRPGPRHAVALAVRTWVRRLGRRARRSLDPAVIRACYAVPQAPWQAPRFGPWLSVSAAFAACDQSIAEVSRRLRRARIPRIAISLGGRIRRPVSKQRNSAWSRSFASLVAPMTTLSKSSSSENCRNEFRTRRISPTSFFVPRSPPSASNSSRK